MCADDAINEENKAGRMAVRGRTFIDGTGDADLAALSGVPTLHGDEDGILQPTTMMFMMSNIDEPKFKPGGVSNAPYSLCSALTNIYPGYANVWGGRLDGVNGLDPWELTLAENKLRREVFELW